MSRPGWMPDPTQELLLHAALDPVPEALTAWRRWTEQVDLVNDEIDADTFRLLSQVYTHLGAALKDDPLAAKLKGITRYQWTKTQLALGHGAEMIALLNQHGIPVIVLKGAALIGMGVTNAMSRSMFDVDILVPPAEVDRALRLLTDAGWTLRYDVPESRQRLLYSFDLIWPGDGSGLDLHQFALADDAGTGADDAFWAGALPVAINGIQTQRLNETDLLLHLLAHGARWTVERSWRWVADVALLLRATPTLDADRLVTAAAARALSLQSAAMLAYLAESFGVPLPAGLIERLRAAPIGPGERLEYWARQRQAEGWGGAAFHLHTYWRLTRRGQRALSPVRYLCDWWGVPRATALPGVMIRRLRRKARAAPTP